MQEVFRYFKFELPSTGIESFEVQRETVLNPQEALKNLLKENSHLRRNILRNDLEAFAKRFSGETGLSLTFTEEASDVLVDKAVDKDKTIRALCEEHFKDLEYGLKIVARNTGRESFDIDKAMAENPDAELSRRVVESFSQRKLEEEAGEEQ